PEASVRIGRIVLPTFMVADSRKVGYANPWVRPPVEVYGLIPITQNDGLDASYRVVWGETASTVQANVGQSDIDAGHGGSAEARSGWGLTASSERRGATVRIGYQQS